QVNIASHMHYLCRAGRWRTWRLSVSTFGDTCRFIAVNRFDSGLNVDRRRERYSLCSPLRVERFSSASHAVHWHLVFEAGFREVRILSREVVGHVIFASGLRVLWLAWVRGQPQRRRAHVRGTTNQGLS